MGPGSCLLLKYIVATLQVSINLVSVLTAGIKFCKLVFFLQDYMFFPTRNLVATRLHAVAVKSIEKAYVIALVIGLKAGSLASGQRKTLAENPNRFRFSRLASLLVPLIYAPGDTNPPRFKPELYKEKPPKIISFKTMIEVEPPSPLRYIIGAAVMLIAVVLPVGYMMFRNKRVPSSSSYSKQTNKVLI
ncbi:uncharacterized protein LOC120173173 [Hibiscus syriacus]|uniref:uncharacterized protein LOC120173173 n=1 Tax=Hibiscus syriacus TaxID=106335 RepID=UPI001925098F|nr:uncharacterized protein LOC120173173 [Hibiscus syriacus]